MLRVLINYLLTIIASFIGAMSTFVVVHRWRDGIPLVDLTIDQLIERQLAGIDQLRYLRTLAYSSDPPTIPPMNMLGALYSTQTKLANNLTNTIGWVKNNLPASEGVPHDVETGEVPSASP